MPAPPPSTARNPTPLLSQIDTYLRSLGDWVRTTGARVRDEGQVFHVEDLVVPKPLEIATPERLDAAHAQLLELDWMIRDAAMATVPRLPEVLETHDATSAGRGTKRAPVCDSRT